MTDELTRLRAENVNLGEENCEVKAERDKALADNARLQERVAELETVANRCAEIIDRNLYHQREKVEGVPRMLRRATGGEKK